VRRPGACSTPSSGASTRVYHRVELTRDVHRQAEHFLLTLAKTPLRAVDALHLALATSARAASLASFDGRLAAAAQAGGLAVYPA
jgi:predicted nucleic acid-binding protein